MDSRVIDMNNLPFTNELYLASLYYPPNLKFSNEKSLADYFEKLLGRCHVDDYFREAKLLHTLNNHLPTAFLKGCFHSGNKIYGYVIADFLLKFRKSWGVVELKCVDVLSERFSSDVIYQMSLYQRCTSITSVWLFVYEKTSNSVHIGKLTPTGKLKLWEHCIWD